ncbi:MAG: hypothetical protein LBC02_03275 [Planctomycetaceae bacterium]|nr:hypothetical protein [Planctomycetaceae bacterium]
MLPEPELKWFHFNAGKVNSIWNTVGKNDRIACRNNNVYKILNNHHEYRTNSINI